MTTNVIDVSGLGKRFGGRTVVDHVSMTVAKGEIAGFPGPNGSGKTTTIRVICGLLHPDGGSGTVLGHDILTESRLIKRQTGYMTQRFSLYEDLSVEENLLFVARLYELSAPSEQVRETLDELGLTERRQQLAGTLSGGWKQRLALAACLMHKPKLLLLDEPTAGVDPRARREFWDEIHARAASGLTVLVSTHYMDEAERCQRVHYISRGRVLASGSVDEVIAQAGLTTFVLQGKGLPDAAHMLSGMDGVDQVAVFGSMLHVAGRDRKRLKASVDQVSTQTGTVAREDKTTLEDVFIQLMDEQ
jgi:ABC-2 type transport system ATP-binding protein